MSSLIDESYNFERVDSSKLFPKYEFVSLGIKEIPKRVVLSTFKFKFPNLENYYNLGFGNIYINPETGKESIDDMSRNNNSDIDKVLKTVLTCVLDFLSSSPDTKITFYGNTISKKRLYNMLISKHIDSIKDFFIVKGGIIIDLVTSINSDGSKNIESTLDIDSTKIENYNTQNSRYYDFIILELIDELK